MCYLFIFFLYYFCTLTDPSQIPGQKTLALAFPRLRSQYTSTLTYILFSCHQRKKIFFPYFPNGHEFFIPSLIGGALQCIKKIKKAIQTIQLKIRAVKCVYQKVDLISPSQQQITYCNRMFIPEKNDRLKSRNSFGGRMIEQLLFYCYQQESYSSFHNVIYMNIQKYTGAGQQLAENEIKFQVENLDSLKLSEIFQEAKFLINSKSKIPVLGQKCQFKKKRLRLILEFVIRKLKSKEDMDVKKYVGLVSLFSLLLTAAQNQQNSLNFPINFYRNLNRYSQYLVEYWENKNQKQSQGERKKILSTFLFALTTFCENSHKFAGLDIKKIFSLGVVKSLLQLKLCDDERILKYYRILMLYIYEHKQQNLSTSLLLSSLIYHFIICSSNSNTQYALIFLLNRFFKKGKISSGELDKYDLSFLALKIKTVIFKEGVSLQMCRLAFSLLSKIVELDQRAAFGLLGVDNFISLIDKLQAGAHYYPRLNPTVLTILGTFTPQESFQVYKHFVNPQRMSTVSLELLEFLTLKQPSTLLVDLIDTGIISFLYSQSEKQHQGHSYNRNLAIRILNNIVHGSSEVSKEISQLLRRLTIIRGDQLLMQSEGFSYY